MSWTNAVVTEAGLALQAKLVDGQTLGFLRVAAGTGTVDPASLANQTALVNEKQTLTFQPPNVLGDAKIKVPVMLNNIGLETGYTMQQLGFFADDPDDGEILYAIVQDEVGDTVPSQTESPGFIIEWAFVFQYGNAGSVTVTLDPVGLVSIGMVGQPNGVAGLGGNGAVPVAQGGTGATTAQDAVVALGALFAIAAAAAYDPEGSYAVGDYCTHGGGLHKCNTAIPDGEAWTAEHWTETTVAAELAEVRVSLSNKADRGESWVPESWMTIPVGKRLWFYTGEKIGYYILNNGIELSIYDHDNNNLLSLLSSRAPTINNGISLATVTPPQKQNISLLNGVQPTDSGCVFWKQQDNVCTVAIACTKPTDGLTPDMIIGTLPVGFRPSYIERAGYAATTAGQSFSGTVRIWSDGNVQIWFPNTSANIFIAEASFPVLDNGGAE